MNTKELEALDLKLFKVCFPTEKQAEVWTDTNSVYMDRPPQTRLRSKTRLMHRFTQDIGTCFNYLIPEMNRRGLWVCLSYDPADANYTGLFWDENGNEWKADNDLPAMAICLAADKAIKSMEGK